MWSSELIKKIRTQTMLSQAEFAKELSVSAMTIIRWEAGKFSPTFKAQRKLKEFCVKNNIAFKEEE